MTRKLLHKYPWTRSPRISLEAIKKVFQLVGLWTVPPPLVQLGVVTDECEGLV